jgi:hypothetical protein
VGGVFWNGKRKNFLQKIFRMGQIFARGVCSVDQTWLDGPNVKKLVFV